MPGQVVQAALLLLQSLAGFMSIMLLLRFFMQAFRVSFNNQIGAFVMQLTDWLVMPIRKIVPAVFGLDAASLATAWLVQLVAMAAVVSSHAGLELLSPQGMALLILARSFAALLRLGINLLIGLLILQAILSWVNPHAPLSRPVSQLTDPFLRPIRKIVPPVAGIDLSPLIAILAAQAVLVFL